MTNSSFAMAPKDVYAIPIAERWMLFSPSNMTAAMVNKAAVKAMSACASVNEITAPETIRHLWRKLSAAPATQGLSPSSPEKMVIIPTKLCNMRCVYCDFGRSGADSTTLDPQLACMLIDDVIRKLPARSLEKLRIHFFGGEPMVARPCVETVVHYARMVCARNGLTPWFEITTNGVFDPTAVALIGDYMDSVVISLDGVEQVHDYNRRRTDGSGTYSTIAANIRELSLFPVELSLRTCVTNRSVDSMTDMTAHFCSEFEFDLLCFEMLTPNESAHEAGLVPPDPYQFAAGSLKAAKIAASHGVQIIHGTSELNGPRSTSCPVGLGTLMLNPDGRLTACYLETERWLKRGLDPMVGRVDPVSGPRIKQQKLDAIASLLDSKPRCVRCFCRFTCAGGCHIEQTPPGCSLEYDDRCRATRIITAGHLLRNLEGTEAVDAFVSQPSSMRSVAENLDDRLTAGLWD